MLEVHETDAGKRLRESRSGKPAYDQVARSPPSRVPIPRDTDPEGKGTAFLTDVIALSVAVLRLTSG